MSATYEGHVIGGRARDECQKISYGSRGERYLNDHPCTCAAAHMTACLELLKEAREHAKLAEAPKTLDRIRKAITSAGGALRNAEHKPYREQWAAEEQDICWCRKNPCECRPEARCR